MIAYSMPGDSLRLNTNNYYLTKGLYYAKKSVQYKIQIDACEKNISSYKIKMDSCAALDRVHKTFENTQASRITKLERKRNGWRNFAIGFIGYAIIRESLNLLK